MSEVKITNEQKKTTTIPNKAYDLEYGTQYRKEVEYLSACGFHYTFIKKNEYGVKTYKYTKTPELFRAIALFYEAQRNEKQFAFLKKQATQMVGDDELMKLVKDSMKPTAM